MNKHDDLVEVSLVYGWKARDGTIYQGEGYPAPLRRFLLDNQNCAALLVKPDATTIQFLTERVAELEGERRRILLEAVISLKAIGKPAPHDPPDAQICGVIARSCLARLATLSNGETK